MKRIELILVDAGGGHRSAADAFTEAVRREGLRWELPVTDLFHLLADLDFSRRLTGIGVNEVYNGLLRRGWTLGFTSLVAPVHSIIRRSHDAQVELLSRHWRANRPDAVISFIPHFNRALHEAIQRVMPEVPLITVLTDLADYPPNFWITERAPQYFVCGTDRARDQALGAGHPADHVFRTSGMIVGPRFYDGGAARTPADYEAIGLDPRRPTAMLMFGGQGSRAMVAIARRLAESGLDLQVIAVCGRNQRLEAAMRSAALRIPMHVTGFTREIPRLMRLSDVFIGKAGPGCISEALVMGLPVIIEHNRWTMPQERYNAEWVEECGFGISVRSLRSQVVEAITVLLDPARRRVFTERVGAFRNRAVFEIPRIVEQLLASSAAGIAEPVPT